MKVNGFRNGDGGCDFYRCHLPMTTAANNGILKYGEIWAEKIISDIMLFPEKFKQNMDVDIYLVQRLSTLSFLRRIRDYIKNNNLNSKVVIDFDDNVFKVSPLSNHYADYGTEDYQITFPDGTRHDAWKDGVNIDLKKNRERLDEIKRVVEKADMITTTTPILANVFKQYNDNVRILSNCIDVPEWNKFPLVKNTDIIKLYWAGGMSHWEDFLLLREPLKVIFNRYPNVKLIMLGWMPDGLMETFPGRVEYHPWSNFHAYPYKAASLGADIGLIPLVDNEFNICKSNIKWIEMSSLQIPTVVSYCSPYKEAETLSDQDLAVFIENNEPEGWIEGISKLIDNPELRNQIGAEARQVVEKHFDINARYHEWYNAYSEVLCALPPPPLLKLA